MAKLTDLSNWEKPDAILNKKGDVLCPICEKRLANITEYGMVRKCDECELTYQPASFNVIECQSISGKQIRTAHVKDIKSRIVTEDGQILRGRDGVKYMENRANKGDAAAVRRLKDYNKI